jgi:hypothetical protein
MQAVRSATNQRRQEGQWGAGDAFDFAAHSEAGACSDAAGPKALVRQPSRFRETIMQAEELSIRRVRVAETAKGGLLLRVFGIGRSFGGLPGSKLIHPNSPFALCVLCCSGKCLDCRKNVRMLAGLLPALIRACDPNQRCFCFTRRLQVPSSWASCGSPVPATSRLLRFTSTSL